MYAWQTTTLLSNICAIHLLESALRAKKISTRCRPACGRWSWGYRRPHKGDITAAAGLPKEQADSPPATPPRYVPCQPEPAYKAGPIDPSAITAVLKADLEADLEGALKDFGLLGCKSILTRSHAASVHTLLCFSAYTACWSCEYYC